MAELSPDRIRAYSPCHKPLSQLEISGPNFVPKQKYSRLLNTLRGAFYLGESYRLVLLNQAVGILLHLHRTIREHILHRDCPGKEHDYPAPRLVMQCKFLPCPSSKSSGRGRVRAPDSPSMFVLISPARSLASSVPGEAPIRCSLRVRGR